MRDTYRHRGGTLILYSADRSRIFGVLAGADWTVQCTPEGITNHVFGGFAGEGTLDELLRANAAGIENYGFDFEADGFTYSGQARLLRPVHAEPPASALIQVETTAEPALSA